MTDQSDIAIIGGGLNGGVLSVALAEAGFSVAVFDRADPAMQRDDSFDGRASAIAAGSRTMLNALGIWDDIEETQPITDILVSDGRVSEGAGSLFLHFDHSEVGDAPFGTMVENRYLRRAILDRLAECKGVSHHAPAGVQAVEYQTGWAVLSLQGGTKHRARLVVACDGRRSKSALAAGVRYTGWDYGQNGIVATVRHEQPHEGVAHEYFLPSGPFAILPLTGNRSSLVWTEKRALADAAMALDDAAFADEVALRFGEFLGETEIEGPRWSYPLNLALADEYVKPRLALVGDAAHGVHPIAGQGLNLGFKDVAALTEVLSEADHRGEDIGDVLVLERYQRWRRFDNTAMALGMDTLNRLFSNDFGPLRAARGIGISLVGRNAPARRFFMRQAAGLSEGLPALMRG